MSGDSNLAKIGWECLMYPEGGSINMSVIEGLLLCQWHHRKIDQSSQDGMGMNVHEA